MEHWDERTRLLLGEELYKKFSQKHILIAGLGGVGGYAAENIVRAGIEKITLIDFDTIKLSNLNRQLISLRTNVGKSKIFEWKNRLLQINPSVRVRVIDQFLNGDNIDSIFSDQHIDYVVDAIDSLQPKVDLITYCISKDIPLISSMGAGGRVDPSKVLVADISKTYGCPLAHKLRKRLHKRNIYTGFKAVFSYETPNKNAILHVNEQNKKTTVGTISYMPALFGTLAAAYLLHDLILKVKIIIHFLLKNHTSN